MLFDGPVARIKGNVTAICNCNSNLYFSTLNQSIFSVFSVLFHLLDFVIGGFPDAKDSNSADNKYGLYPD